VNAIESANLNAETMLAMKKGADALKGIHSSLLVVSSLSARSCQHEKISHSFTSPYREDIPDDFHIPFL